MKIRTCLILVYVLLFISCAGTNKHLRKNRKSVTGNIVPKIKENQISETTTAITEVEEKLVPINEKLSDPHRYFVIIGSFRNPDNTKQYQGQILKKGVSSEIL